MRVVRVFSVVGVCVMAWGTSSLWAQNAPAQTGGEVVAGKVFNPDISAIGNFVGVGGSNPVNPSPAMEMRESEVSLQAVVDPYTRGDFFLAFGQEGVELEEGYITFPALPGGVLGRVGKMRAAFGKVNTLHTHVLPWVDRPLVTQNLVGGDEGISDAGFSIAPRFISVGGAFLEATAQVYRGDAGDVFRSSQPRDLAYVGHLRGYGDLSESTNVDVGFSVGHGHNDAGYIADVDVGRFHTLLLGTDFSVKWRPLSRSIYRSFAARGEIVWSRRQQFDGPQQASGFFVSGEYQFARRWVLGGRYDDSATATDASLRDKGGSALVTYRPSEFSQLRGQYRRTNYGVGSVANEVLLQLQFLIGAHGAHPFY
ncbi:MAG TPA: hypothetical protein VFY29_13990 [Terriglobia bacterium]|nr:hypothetical protein [Terriglobia bacterium]